MNKYEKLISDLKEEFDKEFSEYSDELNDLNYSSNVLCHKYNDQIHVINSLRQNLQDEISELYKFLKRFGNVGVNITPFEYVTEDSKFVNQKTASGSLDLNQNESSRSNFVKTAKVATAIIAPITIPALWIDDALHKRSKNKEEYLRLQINFEEQRTEWNYNLSKRHDEIDFFAAATEIANLYRALIATVRSAIKDTIIPELTGIDAFLVADAIKNCIISDMDPCDAEIMNIDIYHGTAYDMHYIFVRNVFDYYTMIVKFFTEFSIFFPIIYI